jgi:hypothetical protein
MYFPLRKVPKTLGIVNLTGGIFAINAIFGGI